MNGFALEYWMHKKNLVAMDLIHSLAYWMVVGMEIYFEIWKIISTMHKSEGLLFVISLSFWLCFIFPLIYYFLSVVISKN